MKTHADTRQENKSSSVNRIATKENNSEAANQFVDHRDATTTQIQLQKTANNSPQVSQLKTFQELVNTSLSKQTPTLAQTSTNVFQLVSVEEVAAEKRGDATFATNYASWLAKNVKLTEKSEAEIVAPFAMAQLQHAVGQHGVHKRNYELVADNVWEDTSGWTKFWNTKKDFVTKFVSQFYIEKLADNLAASATLRRYASATISAGRGRLLATLQRALKILSPDDFEAAYLAHVKQRQLDVSQNFILQADLTKGFRSGDTFFLRLGSGTPPDCLHTPVHEFIHFLSDPFSNSLFGHDMNEGITEIITEKVMKELYTSTHDNMFNWGGASYAGEQAEVRKMLAVKSLSLDNVMQAYFSILKAPQGTIPKIEAYRENPLAIDGAPKPEKKVSKGDSDEEKI